MTASNQGAPLFVLAALAFVAMGALVSAPISVALRARVGRLDPARRHSALMLLAMLPLLIASALMFASLLPAFASFVVPSLDHCTAHDDVHAHLCFVHRPVGALNLPVSLVMTFVLTYAFVHAVLAFTRMHRALRVVRALAASGEARDDLGVVIVETSTPICVAAGLLRPRILISRGLIDALGPDERAVVLAHEHAHVRRRDALRAVIMRALGMFHVPSVARWLVAERSVAAEEACDEAAAEAVGDRLAVASVILRVERITRASSPSIACVSVGVGAIALERRIEALLRAPVEAGSLRLPLASLVALFVFALAASPELHHATESLLSLVAH